MHKERKETTHEEIGEWTYINTYISKDKYNVCQMVTRPGIHEVKVKERNDNT